MRIAAFVTVALVCSVADVAFSQTKSDSSPATKSTSSYRVPPDIKDGWKTASASSVGMSTQSLEAMTEMVRRYSDWNVHAVLIERKGRLVYEEYFAGEDQDWGKRIGRVEFTPETKHDLRSVTKSVTSALVGIALAEEKIKSLDQPVVELLPGLADPAKPQHSNITLRHILTMSAGLEWNEDIPYTDPRNDEIAMTRSPDAARYVFSKPLVSEPGKRFEYSGGTTHVLGLVVQTSVGQRLDAYARRVLFTPLGITGFDWRGDLNGVPAVASGLRLRPRDLAKFGSLYLHQGKWNGQQVLPPGWVADSTRRHIQIPSDTSSQGTVGYGYQWWHNCMRTSAGILEMPTAVGNGQQRIYVLRDLDMVVTILAGRYNDPTARGLPMRLLLEHILPSVQQRPAPKWDAKSCDGINTPANP